MNKLVAIAAAGPVGPTFLEWSIYYLTGQTQYLHAQQGWSDVVANPLRDGRAEYDQVSVDPTFGHKYTQGTINAHGHRKNVCFGLAQLNTWLDQIQLVDAGTVIWHQMLQTNKSAWATAAGDTNRYKQCLVDDYTQSIDLCLDRGAQVIFMEIDPRINFYFANDRRISQTDLLDDKFFPTQTDDMDPREKAALDQRPFENLRLAKHFQFDRTRPHYNINCLSWWHDGEAQIARILEFLGLPMQQDKLDHWRPIYRQWQTVQSRFLDFVYRVDHIIDAIIHGWYYDVGTLTFNEQVIVLHVLIYHHRLNINLWNLPEWPTNAQDLHKLLIPCVHPVDN
jgi:hypothetical protein